MSQKENKLKQNTKHVPSTKHKIPNTKRKPKRNQIRELNETNFEILQSRQGHEKWRPCAEQSCTYRIACCAWYLRSSLIALTTDHSGGNCFSLDL